MPTYHAVQFGSYVYETGSADPTSWLDQLRMRPLLAPALRSARARTLPGQWEPRVVEVSGHLIAESGDVLRDLQDSFLAAHVPGYRHLYRDDDRYCEAEVREVVLGAQEGLNWYPYTVRFEARDPYLYGTTEESQEWASVLSGATQVITNGGSMPTAPSYTFTVASAGTLDATVSLGSDSFTLSTTVEAADILTVDTLEQTCARTRAGVTSNARGALTGSLFLWPVGANTLTLTLGVGSVALASLVVAWRNRWL